MLCLPVGIPQDIIQLFQRRQENLPELPEDLGIPVVSFRFQTLGKGFQPGFETDFLQKRIQRQHLLPQRGGALKSLTEVLQGGYSQSPGFIQGLQAKLGRFVPHSGQSVRMKRPIREPLVTPDIPDHRIVFHQVTGILIQG